MKALWWTLCAATLAVSAWLGWRGAGAQTVVIAAPAASSGSALGKTPCPPRTLLDDGACVPIPKPADSADVIPRLPARPADYDAYVLPAKGEALLGSWQDVDLELGPRLRGPALIVNAPAGAPVEATLLGSNPVRLRERGAHWLVVETVSDANAKSDALLAVLGPLEVEQNVELGAMLAPGTRLGRTVAGGLGFAVRRQRPGETDAQSLEKWSAHQLVWVDARNVLPLREMR